MKTATRIRRLLAVATGLVIGVAAALATSVSAPATAQGENPNVTAFVDVCEGMYISIITNSATTPDWEVRLDGKLVWPGDGDEVPGPGEAAVIFLPPGVVEVTFDGAPAPDWPVTNTWREPSFCADLPEPTATQPTCEEPGFIDIPALPELGPILAEIFSQTPDLTTTSFNTKSEQQPELPVFTLLYRLDDAEVAPGSSHEVEPGAHVVSLHLIQEQEGALIELVDLTLESWTFQIDEPDCPGDGGGDGDGDGGGGGDDGGGGGDDGGGGGDDGGGDGAADGGNLPKTGVPTGWLAGGALALIVIGGGLYLVARRRHPMFNA